MHALAGPSPGTARSDAAHDALLGQQVFSDDPLPLSPAHIGLGGGGVGSPLLPVRTPLGGGSGLAGDRRGTVATTGTGVSSPSLPPTNWALCVGRVQAWGRAWSAWHRQMRVRWNQVGATVQGKDFEEGTPPPPTRPVPRLGVPTSESDLY